MFQTFEARGDPSHGAERLARLRDRLKKLELQGFIVPHADEHQSEYVPPNAQRLMWLTGFSGSAGTAIILMEEAAIFVDGRYTLQAESQVDTDAFLPVESHRTPPSQWLAEHLSEGMRIGFDPWLLTRRQLDDYRAKAAARAAMLVPLEENPIDGLWENRPAKPSGQVSLHPVQLAGQEASAKIGALRDALARHEADALIVTDPTSVAWALNIRGRDVAHTPVPLAYALVPRENRPLLFIDAVKLPDQVRVALSDLVDFRDPEELGDALRALEGRVLVDTAGASEAVVRAVEAGGAEIVAAADPTIALKAVKNTAEIDGSRAAHSRDGVAMVRYLAWLEDHGAGSSEIDAARQLEALRGDTARVEGSQLEDISFDTIAGAGPHGAIVHYRVNEATSRRLAPGELFLVDSGAQYRDGTTDITRTVLIGDADPEKIDEMRDRFTLVLKGHIAIATARFPAGTRGLDIDALARRALWDRGLDYAHGTGHGVGSYLGVHEGPQNISRRGTAELLPGMIVSNEPGFYRPGAYGIRIENLVLVRPAAPLTEDGSPFLSFETLTLAPIDRRLINRTLLTPRETAWLDAYHARVRATLSGSPALDPAARDWLARATVPVG